MRLLIAEDEQNLNQVLARQLTGQGYQVDACLNGEDAWSYLLAGEYDAVILDIMMPGLSGLDILRRLREQNDCTPVLLLTALDSVSQRVEGLDTGADDYLTKPFAFEELLARVRALIRKGAGSGTNMYTLADLKVDTQRKQAWREQQEIDLTSKEFAILEYMIINQNTVLSRDKLEQHIWGYDYEGSSNMIDVYIRYLRKKVDDPFEKKLIHTVRGTGYVLKEKP